jgi:hypothetical protein
MSNTNNTLSPSLENEPMTEAERQKFLANQRSKRWRERHKEQYRASRPEYDRRARESERKRQHTIARLELEQARIDAQLDFEIKTIQLIMRLMRG